MRVLLEPLRLAEQQELGKANQLDLVRQLSPSPGQGGGSALDQLCRPLEVVRVVVPGLQRAEQSVVLQPARVVLAKLPVSGLEVRAGAGTETAQAVWSKRSLNGMTVS